MSNLLLLSVPGSEDDLILPNPGLRTPSPANVDTDFCSGLAVVDVEGAGGGEKMSRRVGSSSASSERRKWTV